MRRQQGAAGRRDLRRHHRQQPDGRHLGRLCSCRVNIKNGMTRPQASDMATSARHSASATVRRPLAPKRDSEDEEAIDDGREPHRDAAKEHRGGRMREDPPRAVEEKPSARHRAAKTGKNRPILNSHRARAASCSPGTGKGNWFSASARPPVPMVAANQFGVNWRTISRRRFGRAGGLARVSASRVRTSVIMGLLRFSGDF